LNDVIDKGDRSRCPHPTASLAYAQTRSLDSSLPIIYTSFIFASEVYSLAIVLPVLMKFANLKRNKSFQGFS